MTINQIKEGFMSVKIENIQSELLSKNRRFKFARLRMSVVVTVVNILYDSSSNPS